MTDRDQTTEMAELENKLDRLARKHRWAYEDMCCIENEMDDIRKQLKAMGHRAFQDE